MVKFRALTKILPFCGLLFSCAGGEKPAISEPLLIHRFEKDLFAVDTTRFAASVKELAEKYPAFFNTHFRNVFGTMPGDTAGYRSLRKTLSNRYIRAVASDIDSVYPDLAQVSAHLSEAFGRYRKAFPSEPVPAVFTYPASISGFRPAVWNADSLLAIGIDCFLGADYYFYRTTSFPRYITRRFTPEHLVPMALKGYVQYHFAPPAEQETFLSAMVHEGKVLYLLDRLLPETPDSLKIGYTREQMEWAVDYERDIWAWFIEQDLLYSAVAKRYRKYLDEAPFTTDLGPHSAPRVGAFTGWQIVRRYMEKNPEVSPAQLMSTGDAQKILSSSGYKPR